MKIPNWISNTPSRLQSGVQTLSALPDNFFPQTLRQSLITLFLYYLPIYAVTIPFTRFMMGRPSAILLSWQLGVLAFAALLGLYGGWRLGRQAQRRGAMLWNLVFVAAYGVILWLSWIFLLNTPNPVPLWWFFLPECLPMSQMWPAIAATVLVRTVLARRRQTA